MIDAHPIEQDLHGAIRLEDTILFHGIVLQKAMIRFKDLSIPDY
jgi:hypothetical protein